MKKTSGVRRFLSLLMMTSRQEVQTCVCVCVGGCVCDWACECAQLPKHRPHLFLSKLGRLIFFLRYKIYNVCWYQMIKVGFFFTRFSFLKCTFYSFVFDLVIFFSETKDFIQLGTIKFTTDTSILTLPVFVLMCSYYQICVIWNHISIFFVGEICEN